MARHEHVFHYSHNVLILVLHGHNRLWNPRISSFNFGFLGFGHEAFRFNTRIILHKLHLAQNLEHVIIMEANAGVRVVLDMGQGKAGVVVLERGLAVRARPDRGGHQVLFRIEIAEFSEDARAQA